MSRRRRKSRPGEKAALPNNTLATSPSLPDTAAARVFDGCFAVYVQGSKANYRRLYLALAPAERAVKRAHARGDAAELLLVRLSVVGGGPDA